MRSDFDYLVIGAGSAGAALAARLSEDPATRVCLVEAGPRDRSPFIHVPLGLIWLSKDAGANWLFKSAPQAALDGREVSAPRGKVLGGSSSINGMIYIRGRRADYDAWAELGGTGWGYDDVPPFFKRAEANGNAGLSDAHHGRSGPLSVQDQRSPSPVDRDFIEAAGKLQIRPCADFNAPEPEGVGIYQVTQKDGRRHSSAAAYLGAAKGRKNLEIRTGLEALEVLIEGGRAVGARFRGAGGEVTIHARGEVILCAGAIGSPDLLLRSGIGPGAEVARFGEVVADLPGVGRNLQDHVDCMIICRSASTRPYGISVRAAPKLALDGIRWALGRRGMLSSNMVEAGGFVRSSAAEERPDIQFHIIPGLKSHRGRMIEYGHGVSLHTCVLRPDSRGSVTRDGPEGPPRIDLGLLNDDRDMERLLRGIRLGRRILAESPMADLGLSEVVPGEAATDDAALRAHVRTHARTVYHPVGTCAMGVGPGAVVDPRLRVRGVAGLRVADASVMPLIVSGNTNAPAIMIGEKAADLIREDARAGLREAAQ
ncbi:GMC family oxidoreductase [Rhodovulum sp. DZ06]|uniref:GMC family oxidoreductase n=1 Tax=Rhodovulum sp. DZ06 TaxID=3425126 RepID=UPI003D356EBB